MSCPLENKDYLRKKRKRKIYNLCEIKRAYIRAFFFTGDRKFSSRMLSLSRSSG